MELVSIETKGLVKIKPGKWSEENIGKIAAIRGLSDKDVRAILAYNVLSVPQLSILTGLSESRIYNATNSIKSKRTGEYSSMLTPCNPFPDSKGGKLFVLVDEKCINFIIKRLGK